MRDLVTPTTTVEELALLSQTECIPVYDQRPDKPFDRDTEVRLTGEQLAARGAVDLATALALLPDVTVREAGRGGYNIDIRGGRKGEVAIMIDGVDVNDPYYGTFDLTSIPITDIVQIRVATTPQSPIDGPGGPGGVIEVSTRDAIGKQLVIARLELDTLPRLTSMFGQGAYLDTSATATATARTMVADHTALRLSMGQEIGGPNYSLLGGRATIGDDARDTSGAARLEYRNGDARAVGDVFVDSKHYVNLPNDEQEFFLDVDRETTVRADVKADDKFDGYQVQGEVGMQYLHRISRTFSNPTMSDEEALEDLTGWREQASALITKPINKEWRWAASTSVVHETCDVGTQYTITKNCHQEIIEPAGDIQYEHKTIRLDASLGEAVPLFIGASPWWEGKFIARWRPNYGHLEVIGTAGRKGRVPSLRERNDPSEGNPALGPEIADAFEVRAIEHVNERVHVELAPFYRHTSGTILIAPVPQGNPLYGRLINLGVVDFWGADLLGRVTIVKRLVEVGGGYSYIEARSYSDPNSNDDVISTHPLPRLPENRFDAWVQATPMPRLSLIARAIYFGSAYGGGNNGNGLLPAYTTIEATATWQINNQYLFVLRAEDLTNTRPEFNNNVYGLGTEIFAILQATWD